MSAKRLGEEGGHASLLVSERSLQLNVGCVNSEEELPGVGGLGAWERQKAQSKCPSVQKHQ